MAYSQRSIGVIERMPGDLSKFIELLYAVVIGVAFGDISKSAAFKNLMAGRVRSRELINNFLLISSILVFVISDYVVFMWAASHGGQAGASHLYRGNLGAAMFIIDVVLLSLIYFLTSIATLEVSPRRLGSFLFLFILWHALVAVWWTLDGIRAGKGAFSSMPRPHLVRAGMYSLMFGAYGVAIQKDWGNLKRGYDNDRVTQVNTRVMTMCVVLVSGAIGVVSLSRFLEFHARIFAG